MTKAGDQGSEEGHKMDALIIKPQYGPGARREWTIQRPDAGGQRSEATGAPKAFIAYTRTWTGARKAISEIEASLRRWDERMQTARLTQELIDCRPRHQRPMGTIRELLWKAASR